MTKPTQAINFRKKQVLSARALNQALHEYGSVDGVIPFTEDGKPDTTFAAPLGTKETPFGNAYFKGMNIYTQVEVLNMVQAGKLTANDRMVFWNLDTNNLSAWNGSEIIHLGDNGGGSMEYLFGSGEDGDVTMVANGTFDTVKNFTNFTLNAGVTLSRSVGGTPMILKCTGTCTINGTINLDGKGWPAGMGYGKPLRTWNEGAETSYAVTYSDSQYSSIAGLTAINRKESGSFDENITYFLASVFDFANIALMGGGGATDSSGVSSLYGYGAGSGGHSGFKSNGGNVSAPGGAGGGGLIIIAKKIIHTGVISAAGQAGGYVKANGFGNKSESYGGGGGGGGIILMANEIVGSGSYNCAGGGVTSTQYAGVGGSGGYVKVII
ncbi:hypothetical protein [Candidatus Avelusimicrobium faecicola]|uniref:hypothetical protein n=1 Tax=Candidatus Avelusimicrobium faecicola TaxID=3416205 RepID=UPI00205177BD|nr:MAG TPA: hypothetical protein [Caudoviricetes sp.]